MHTLKRPRNRLHSTAALRLLGLAMRVLCVAWFVQPVWAHGVPVGLITFDEQALERTHQRIRDHDATVAVAFAALLQRAEKALRAPLRSVTDKSKTPPSGSKHDYTSMGPYWWPNPASADGLPYIQRDGQRNPEVLGNGQDAQRLQAMVLDCRDLALAYRFTAEPRYAHKLAAVIRTWFLAPATRMNPNLRYAQSIPGVVDGRGIGIIDTRDLWMVMDGVVLIAPSGALKTDEYAGLRQWFVDYAEWMHSSPLGQDEAAEKNNHGMFYDAQLAALWLFTGQTERARSLVFAAQTLRFASQIDSNGRLPLELARTRPFHYHTFTLEAATRLAHYGRALALHPIPGEQWPASDVRCRAPWLHPSCPMDVWRAVIDGKSLRAVLDIVAGAVVDPKTWAHATALEPAPALATALAALLMAQQAYPAGAFDAALTVLRDVAPDHVAWLTFNRNPNQ